MDIKELVKQLTLEEKAGFCSGSDFWHTKAVERLGIPKVMLSDGPHGLRKQDDEADHLGINDSIKAVCFPSGCAMASSFDRNLMNSVGQILGNECQAENLSVLLGPAVNIKRSPLCGRNFEYFSEDPYLTSEIAINHINGVQSKNVGTSIKHFLANNQEHLRMTSNSVVDERTLREIYLAAFEGPIKEAQPWTVMCSYNRVNGTYASENPRFLTEILKDEWGFEGYVVSDWGAVNNRVESLKAGLELEMPPTNGLNDQKIIDAVKSGELDESILDAAVERFLNIVFKYSENRDETAVFDRDKDHELSRQAATECAVLLKNDNILPLDKNKKIAFIGKFAETPRYQGGGSSFINSHKITGALEAVKEYTDVTFAEGYGTKEDVIDEKLFAEAIEVAKNAEIVVFFGGLPDSFESEGFDRTHLEMPNVQNKLLEELSKVQKNIVVVLHNGSPVTMPWLDNAKGVLEVYLGGQAVGGATVDLLFGKVNPSGKLAETFPIKLSDNPSYLNFPGEGQTVEYKEGIFVGYRYYDKKEIEVLFPFGFGLSYTEFEYSNLNLSSENIKDTDTLKVSVDVKNIGSVKGKEIVQVYVGQENSKFIKAIRELRNFDKVELEPGETKTVSFELSKRAFAYYNVEISDWHVETGTYTIEIGKSSRDIVLVKNINVESTVIIPVEFDLNSTFGEVMSNPIAMEIMQPLIAGAMSQFDTTLEEDGSLGEATQIMMQSMMQNMPLRALISFSGGKVKEADFLSLVAVINKAIKEV